MLPLTIGITGRAGSGKSLFSSFLSDSLNALLLNTDAIARELTESDRAVHDALQKAFGPGVFAPDGAPDRSRLAREAFASAAARQSLESILHPRIRVRWKASAAEAKNNGRHCVVEIPLLFETAAEAELDLTISVLASELVLKRRLQERGWSEGRMQAVLDSQVSTRTKIEKSDFVVWNDGRISQLERQARHLCRTLEAPSIS